MILRVGKVENISKHISNNSDENLNKISNLLYEYRESTNNSLKSNLESQFKIQNDSTNINLLQKDIYIIKEKLDNLSVNYE